MAKIDFDGRITYDKKDQTERQRKFVESIQTNNLHCVDKWNTKKRPTQEGCFSEKSKAFHNSQCAHRVTDEYGNVVTYDSNGNIDSIMVSPYKID